MLAAAGAEWEAQKIEDALLLMYGDAHMEDRQRLHTYKSMKTKAPVNRGFQRKVFKGGSKGSPKGNPKGSGKFHRT